MKIIAHISDLHFGREDKKIAEGLLSNINNLLPHVVTVSGDLTQRARTDQFIKAKYYLDKIKPQKIIIPGNHDIPLFDIFKRFFFPLVRYQRYISYDLNPVYEDNEIILLGINTARSLTWKEGRISIEQINGMKNILCKAGSDKFKIVMTHHPFIPPPGDLGISLVGRSVKALKVFDECKVNLLLAGHLHQGYSGDVRPFYPSGKHSVISAQAGTAISNRRRNEPNAYNLISVENNLMGIEIRTWNGKIFEKSLVTMYRLEDDEWKKEI